VRTRERRTAFFPPSKRPFSSRLAQKGLGLGGAGSQRRTCLPRDSQAGQEGGVGGSGDNLDIGLGRRRWLAQVEGSSKGAIRPRGSKGGGRRTGARIAGRGRGAMGANGGSGNGKGTLPRRLKEISDDVAGRDGSGADHGGDKASNAANDAALNKRRGHQGEDARLKGRPGTCRRCWLAIHEGGGEVESSCRNLKVRIRHQQLKPGQQGRRSNSQGIRRAHRRVLAVGALSEGQCNVERRQQHLSVRLSQQSGHLLQSAIPDPGQRGRAEACGDGSAHDAGNSATRREPGRLFAQAAGKGAQRLGHCGGMEQRARSRDRQKGSQGVDSRAADLRVKAALGAQGDAPG